VRDAVLVRFSRLSPPARAIVELTSLSPGAAEQWLIRELLQPDPATLDECLERGILRPGGAPVGGTLAFRHELARGRWLYCAANCWEAQCPRQSRPELVISTS